MFLKLTLLSINNSLLILNMAFYMTGAHELLLMVILVIFLVINMAFLRTVFFLFSLSLILLYFPFHTLLFCQIHDLIFTDYTQILTWFSHATKVNSIVFKHLKFTIYKYNTCNWQPNSYLLQFFIVIHKKVLFLFYFQNHMKKFFSYILESCNNEKILF